MSEIHKVTRVEVIDHTGEKKGRVFVKYDVDAILHYQDNGRTLKIIVADREKLPVQKVTLHLSMNTDDDAEIVYMGRTYCQLNEDLEILKQFDTRELAVAHVAQNLRVVYGGKADKFTQDWITASIYSLKQGKKAEVVCGNQEYLIEIEETNYD
jgi:hypothetical protein